MGYGALTLFTLHKRLKVRNQPHLPSRAWLGGGWSEVQGGGGHRMLEAHAPCREVGLGGAARHPSWVLLGPRTCLLHTERMGQGPECKSCPGQAEVGSCLGRPAWFSKRGPGQQQQHCLGRCPPSDPLHQKLRDGPSHWGLNKPPGDSDGPQTKCATHSLFPRC